MVPNGWHKLPVVLIPNSNSFGHQSFIMSYNTGQVCAAPQFQTMLDDHFRTCSPHSAPFSVGTLMFIRSQPNMDNVMQDQLTANTQRRTVEIIWMQRDQKSNVTESCTQDCDGGDEEGTNCETYLITECIDRVWTITPTDWELSEKPVEFWAVRDLQSKINAMTGRLNEEVIADISANFGVFPSLNNPGPFNTTTSTANVETSGGLIQDVAFESEDSGFCTMPTLIGWDESFRYVKRVAAGCCADPLGLDVNLFAAQNPFRYIADKTISEQIGVNHFISLDMGAVQVFTWNRFQGGLREVNSESYFAKVIIDPFTGIPFDYIGRYDCGVWHFQLMLHYLTAFAPATSFPVDDEHDSVNGVQHYLVAN